MASNAMTLMVSHDPSSLFILVNHFCLPGPAPFPNHLQCASAQKCFLLLFSTLSSHTRSLP